MNLITLVIVHLSVCVATVMSCSTAPCTIKVDNTGNDEGIQFLGGDQTCNGNQCTLPSGSTSTVNMGPQSICNNDFDFSTFAIRGNDLTTSLTGKKQNCILTIRHCRLRFNPKVTLTKSSKGCKIGFNKTFESVV